MSERRDGLRSGHWEQGVGQRKRDGGERGGRGLGGGHIPAAKGGGVLSRRDRSSGLTQCDLACPFPLPTASRVVTCLPDCYLVTSQSFKRGKPFTQ